MGKAEGTRRHHQVVRILFDLCNATPSYSEVHADHVLGHRYETVNILSHHGRRVADVYPYNPDLWCKLKKSRGIDVIEVWDGQTEEASVKDVLFAALTPNVETLSIVCFDDETKELGEKLGRVILGSIFNNNKQLLLSPEIGETMWVTRIPDEARDEIGIRRFLSKELNLAGGQEDSTSGWLHMKHRYPNVAAVNAKLRERSLSPGYREKLHELKVYWQRHNPN